MKSNVVVKPLAVLTASAPSIVYLLTKMSIGVKVENDMVLVSESFVKSFQGSLVVLILLISIINIYKPSKIVIISLVVGGMSLLASSILQTIGFTFLTYGLGLLFNTLTLNKVIVRNDKLRDVELEYEVDKIIKEAIR